MEAVPLILSILRSMVRLLMPDQPAMALEIAWFVYQHPASLQDDKDEVSPLIETLQAELPPQMVAQIQAQAQNTTLESMINRLLPR